MPSDGCVYVVDDDEAVRDALSGLLEAGGYLCRAFSSAGIPQGGADAASGLFDCRYPNAGNGWA